MYECITGLRNPANLGAVLADEMGLGWGLPCAISQRSRGEACVQQFKNVLELQEDLASDHLALDHAQTGPTGASVLKTRLQEPPGIS